MIIGVENQYRWKLCRQRLTRGRGAYVYHVSVRDKGETYTGAGALSADQFSSHGR